MKQFEHYRRIRTLRLLKVLFATIIVAVVLSPKATFGFSMHGPTAPWQTARLNYDRSWTIPGWGPMNIGDEYRWNVPVIYYGFSGDFLKFFGQRGAQEVDKAAQIINDLPTADKLNPDDYPMTSMRMNLRASAVGLMDLKSYTLTAMLGWMGIDDSTIRVWTLRTRWTTPGATNYYTISRNFDPITYEYTPYINGVLYTYTPNDIIDDDGTGHTILVPSAVTPNTFQAIQQAPVSARSWFSGNFGAYWTGLTRDDVGGLKYLYRPDNYHVENIPPGVTASGGGGGNSPVGIPLTPGNSGVGSPFGIPINLITNLTFTNTLGTNLTGATVLDPAIRGGANKVVFERVNYDSLIGAFFTPTNTSYNETIIANGQQFIQNVSRVVFSPDILFDGGDLQGGDSAAGFVTAAYTTPATDNNDNINGLTATAAHYGPGVILPGVGTPTAILTLNTVGRIYLNTYPNVDELTATQSFLWGTFDGSTNTPIIYPSTFSINEIEQRILNGR